MRYDGIVFDLGNTLVPWGERETGALYRALQGAFETLCGPMPDFFERAIAARAELIEERANGSMREFEVGEFVERVCDGAPPPGLAEAVERATHDTFLEIVRVPGYVRGLLDELRRDRPLAVLSNFYMTSPVEAALKKTGLWDCFVHVEVSATGGLAKPHPAPFETVREKLGTPMERTLMVGDEFWADIVGGNRAGFVTALTHEHRRGPTRDERAPDVRADRIIHSLEELREPA